MNKNAIQKYAVWARNELIDQVKQRAFQYGISEMDYGDENATVIAGRVLTADEKKQRRSFVEEIKKTNYKQAVEEVAYTWFNRFVALRFMEVNDYLPSHVRVFSDTSGNFKPEILTNVLHLDFSGLDKVKVSELLHANQTEDLYRYLLLTQCNALSELLPEMFERMGAYTEMLLPNNILKADSVIGRLVLDIQEEDFNDAVQIIGWLYQYYNTEPKQAVFDGLKKNIKITKENIPAATQLFTPDWIVRYMVENSLGRLWLESHPISPLREGWEYYLDEAEQTPEVAERLRVLRTENAVKSPEEIKVIDPCMGSGHILVYAFDVLMQIYTSEGYSERDATKLILEKNLFGLEIDRRAYQLAYFALMMKARQYNRRILTLGVRPQVYEPTGYADGMEYGSLVRVDKLESMPEQPKEHQMTLFDGNYEAKLNAWNFRRLLAQKYDVCVTNPPYMGSKGMSAKLSDYVQKYFPDNKGDLFAVFIKRGLELIKLNGYNCMVTMQSWMFLSSFETMRKKILSTRTITTLMHMENMVMGIAFGTVVSNLYGKYIDGYKGVYNHVKISDIKDDVPVTFPPVSKRNTSANADNFAKIPGSPVAYWVGDAVLKAFGNSNLGKLCLSGGRFKTCNDELYLRMWFEVDNTSDRWHNYIKGGDGRKHYGNLIRVIDWSPSAQEYYRNNGGMGNRDYWGHIGITWSTISTSVISFRLKVNSYFNSSSAPTVFLKNENDIHIILAFLNCTVAEYLLNMLNPTASIIVNDVLSLPFMKELIPKNVSFYEMDNIKMTRTDLDAFETSWNFAHHPLLNGERTVASAFAKWELEAHERFDTLKHNEEELNRIFIDIYGLQDELTPEVEDKDVTVRRADLGREIRSLISYAVGCMFGRYSLDCERIAYAGGKWDVGKYKTFTPDMDNIIPVCDDEYFDDDIAGRFVVFVKTVYGADTLEENLKYISDALGGKSTPREVIRNYFLNDFYTDHLKIYQKRPIYWLFDSGKKNGFKALFYIHRYSRDLLAKLRTDYVHEQQERYRTQLSHIAGALNTAIGSERARLTKQQDKLSEQAREIGVYEEKVHHLADMHILIDLDDGVMKNYEIFADVLAKI